VKPLFSSHVWLCDVLCITEQTRWFGFPLSDFQINHPHKSRSQTVSDRLSSADFDHTAIANDSALDGETSVGFNARPFNFPTRRTIFLETLLGRPLEVEVRDSIEKAMKILKQKMSKEGILQEIKRRRYYEKPSVKKKRKMREARKRRRREQKRRVVR
jgi:small subunit ribosomal protein S21